MSPEAPKAELITTKLVDSLYVESMALMEEGRRYFEAFGKGDRALLDPMDRVLFSTESLKVTTRMMHVISWLLTRKAVKAGEITEAEAAEPQRRLGPARDSDLGLESRLLSLPPRLISLISDSQDIYARVARLDRSNRGEEPAASPARALLNRLENSF